MGATAKAKMVIGSIERVKDGSTHIHRESYGQGSIYKNWQAFETGNGICYVPELSDSMYTRKDFLEMCNGQEDVAKEAFESVDWQHPETYVDELFREGELDECMDCGKWFWSHDSPKCPYCGGDGEKAEYDLSEK